VPSRRTLFTGRKRASIPGQATNFTLFKNALSILGLTQSPVQRVMGVERPEREADHSPMLRISGAIYTFTLPT